MIGAAHRAAGGLASLGAVDALDLPRKLVLAACVVDFAARCVRWPDEERTLTPTEVKLLGHLASQEGRVVSQRDLLKEVWGYRGGVVSRTVKTTMGRLRAKVERDPSKPDHLLTVVGAGYRFRASDPRPEEPTIEEEISRRPETRPDLPEPPFGIFGRDAQSERIVAALTAGALVTLVGPAGVGKSRLALDVAIAAASDGDFVEVHRALAEAAQDADRLAGLVATALGIDPDAAGDRGPPTAVASALRGRGRVLLLLDDLDASAGSVGDLLTDWLDACPELALLATCRRPLGVRVERVEAVKPLEVQSASRLFLERAGSTLLAGHRDPSRLAPVLQRLDGLPLAIEMAAGWAGFLGPEDLRTRLDRQLDLLRASPNAPGRHTSLAAAFASSWALLDSNERDALSQAAVFAGTFSVEAAEWVVRPPSGEPLQVLRRLCDLSLVQQVDPGDGGSPALRLLHAVREFARSGGPLPDTEERHAQWFARLGSRDSIDALDDQGGVGALARLEAARADLRLAAERAPTMGLADAAAGCARALLAVARFRGPILDGSDTADRVLAMPDLDRTVAADLLVDRSRALFAAGRAAQANQRLDRAQGMSDDPGFRAEVLRLRASGIGTRDTAAALELAVAALAEAEAMGGTREIGRSKCTLGVILRASGRGHDAKEHLDAAVELLRAVGDARTECTALEHLGRHALDRSRPVRARSLFQAALDLSRLIGARSVEAEILERLATLAALSGSEHAGEEFEKALVLRRSLGHRLGEGYTLANLGAFEAERRPAAAREPLEKALGIALEVADKRLETSSRANLGELYLDLGRLDFAARHLELALPLALELGQPRLEGFVRGVMAQVCYARGDDDAGRVWLAAALQILSGAAIRADLVRLLDRAVQCELDAGRPELANDYLAQADQARELSRVDRPATLIR